MGYLTANQALLITKPGEKYKYLQPIGTYEPTVLLKRCFSCCNLSVPMLKMNLINAIHRREGILLVKKKLLLPVK